VPMNDLIFAFWIFGTFYGFLYPTVVGLVFGACLLSSRTFRPRPAQWLPLLLPGATYYVLEELISRRQDWNMPYAVIALCAFASLTAVISRVAKRPGWLRFGTAFGMILAFALWLLLPQAKWNQTM
jgi:hypothetical protein